MIQISPDEKLAFAYQISDPLDTTTYYVQAILRDTRSNETLKTVNLTDKGSGRFTGETQAPVDGSGLGRYIDVETKVYTDSGYSTVSAVYEIDTKQYLIQQRWNQYLGGGGGVGIDYKTLRKIVKEEVEKMPKTDLDEVVKGLAVVNMSIHGIDIPEPSSMEPVVEAIGKVKEEITSLPRFKETDLSPVIEAVNSSEIKRVNNLISSLTQIVGDNTKSIKEKVEEIKLGFEQFEFVLKPVNKRKVAPVTKEELKRAGMEESVKRLIG